MAQIYFSKNDFPQAISTFRQAIGRATDPVPLQLSLAQAYVAAGDPASAVTELQSIVDRGKAHPKYPQARKLLADLRRR